MHCLFLRFQPPAWLAAFFLLAVTVLFSACQKTDNTDYAARDEQLITAYIKDKNLTGFVRQESGLYVAITEPGTGPNAQAGQAVSAKYTGTTLDGNVFDSTTNRNDTPLTFPLGRNKVIAGWDEGFALLNQGSKAILLIPSDLAYGGQAVGTIPAHSVLRFDVEVTGIQ